jgi:hypothetical protein
MSVIKMSALELIRFSRLQDWTGCCRRCNTSLGTRGLLHCLLHLNTTRYIRKNV